MAMGRNHIRFCLALALVWMLPGWVAAQYNSWAKRGYADVSPSYNYLQATNAGWYYRWGPDKPNINFDAQFVPMFWNGGQVTTSKINEIKALGDAEWVLGFNEPERGDQANMTVEYAIDRWRVLSAGFAGSGIKLASPGVADTGGADGGQAWLNNFMNQANAEGLQVDAIAFHWYGASTPNDPIGAANQFLSRVDSYHNQYGKPVWITEFAINDWGNQYTQEQMRVANRIFLDYVIPRLDSRAHVLGYAWYLWFGDAATVEGNPLTPTDVGEPWVGTIRAGTSINFSGQDWGEHVVYLGGGELGIVGRNPGTIRYINALENVSTLSNGADWSLAGTNWVRVQPGATLRKSGVHKVTWNGITTNNNGIIDIASGELRLAALAAVNGTGKLVLNAGAKLGLDGGGVGRTQVSINQLIEFRGGTVDAIIQNHAFNNGGVVYNTTTFLGAGSLTISGALTQGTAGAGLVKQGIGKLTLAGENSYSGATQIDEGTLAVTGKTGFGATTVAMNAVLEGTGTVRGNLTARTGALVRSNTLRVDGAYVQQSGATLELKLSGETLFDRLIVAGNLAADGTLAVVLDGVFVPQLGQVFDLLDFGSFSGGFTALSLPQLGGGLGWEDDGQGLLQVVSVAIPGDYNSNGTVDAADYSVWRDSVGQTGTNLAADGDGNEVVDDEDYTVWKSNFGQPADDGAARWHDKHDRCARAERLDSGGLFLGGVAAESPSPGQLAPAAGF